MRNMHPKAARTPYPVAMVMASRTSICPGTYQNADDMTPATNASPTVNRSIREA